MSENRGIAFTLLNSPWPEKHQIETLPRRANRGDGHLDLFLRTWRANPGLKSPNQTAVTARNREGGRSDFDNHGFADLFVVGVNGNFPYRNRGLKSELGHE